MKKSNGLINVLVIIMTFICIIQMFQMSMLKEKIDSLHTWQKNAIRRIEDLEYDIRNLSSNESKDMKISIKSLELDYANNKAKLEVTVMPKSHVQNIKLVADNQVNNITLTEKEGVYVGVLEYPIDSEIYETNVYMYDGFTLVAQQLIDYIGAGTIAGDSFKCDFGGFTSYGNGRFTLAGQIMYSTALEDVKEVKMSINGKSVALDKSSDEKCHVNESFEVGKTSGTNETEIKSVYVEYLCENGYTYRIYPRFVGWNNNKSEAACAFQNYRLEVRTDDLKEFSIIME